MAKYKNTCNALILFADVIDSSKYSAVLGIKKYVENILKYQKLFKDLATEYFRKGPLYSDLYCEIRVHGDEGAIFLPVQGISDEDVVSRAIQFSFELKARMEFAFFENDPTERVAQKFSIGIGIHYGQVAIITGKSGEEKVASGAGAYSKDISRVEGYNINYCKRIESCSRKGLFSKIFLSKEAANLVKNKTIVTEAHKVSLKGITPAIKQLN